MRPLRSLYRDSFLGNQAGNSSVGYLLLAIVVGLAGISSLTAFGDASELAVADKAASATAALPVVGGDANAAQEAILRMEDEASLGDDSQLDATEAVETAAPADVDARNAGAQDHGSSVSRGLGKLALGVASAFAAKTLLTAALTGVTATVGPFAAGALAGAAAVLGLDAWHDIHPGSFHAVSRWINDSFIGDAARWVKDSFVGDAFRWVTGDHFIGNTLSGVVGGAWIFFSTVVRGGITAAAAVGETAINAVKTVGMFAYDKIQLDRLFGDEFSDYRSLRSYPATSLFWNSTVDAAEHTWRYLRRIGHFNRPDVAAQIGTIAEDGRTEVTDEGTPIASDGSWPYDMQVGDTTTSFDKVLTELGIDPAKADFDGTSTMTFTNENGGTDVVGMFIEGNDTEGYRVDAVVQRAGSDEPESIFAYQMTAEELKQYGDNLASAAAEQAGLDFKDFKETSKQQTYNQVEPGKSQTFAALTMDGADIVIQGAQVDLENAKNNTVPMTSSYWRFSMVDEAMTKEPADGEYVDAVFELVEAEANTSVVEVAPSKEATPREADATRPNSSTSNIPR